jgi:hypothetical protein
MGVGGGGIFVAAKIVKNSPKALSVPEAEFMNAQFRALLDYRLNCMYCALIT